MNCTWSFLENLQNKIWDCLCLFLQQTKILTANLQVLVIFTWCIWFSEKDLNALSALLSALAEFTFCKSTCFCFNSALVISLKHFFGGFVGETSILSANCFFLRCVLKKMHSIVLHIMCMLFYKYLAVGDNWQQGITFCDISQW